MSDDLQSLAERLLGLTADEAEKVLSKMAEIVKDKTSKSLSSLTEVPSEPGLYVIYDPKCNEVAYVGETGNLAERHDDLERTENHTFRRALGNDILKTKQAFSPIHDTKSKFAPHLEEELSNAMKKYKAVFLPLHIGRKELEEQIVRDEKRHTRRTQFYNRKQRRA